MKLLYYIDVYLVHVDYWQIVSLRVILLCSRQKLVSVSALLYQLVIYQLVIQKYDELERIFHQHHETQLYISTHCAIYTFHTNNNTTTQHFQFVIFRSSSDDQEAEVQYSLCSFYSIFVDSKRQTLAAQFRQPLNQNVHFISRLIAHLLGLRSIVVQGIEKSLNSSFKFTGPYIC